MIYLAAALAWVGTLAFAGWVLWLRDRKGETVISQIDFLMADSRGISDKVHALDRSLIETRSIVDTLQIKAGFTPKR